MPSVDTRLWLLVALALCAYASCAYNLHEEEFVCGLNNTTHPRPCNVSCNNTYLVLSYQGSDTAGYWIRGNESGPYVDINGHPLNPFHPICWEQNCTLNKTLTNDDSGPYFFIPYSFLPGPTQQYPRVIVNILAPPKLLNVVECDYEENRCKKAMTTFVQNRSFNMSVEFIGNGPFKVTWTFNGEPYLCSEHKLCQIITKTNRQILEISSEYPTQVNGTYVATVSNRYGYIEASMIAYYDCNGAPAPHIGGNENCSRELTEGSPLNFFCHTSGLSTLELFGCYTRDKHKSFSDIENDTDWNSYCADLPLVDTKSINRSSGIIVQKTAEYCPPNVQMNFKKDRVTLSDSGLIYCAYLSGDEVKLYKTLDLSVVARPVKTIYYAAPISAFLGAMIVVVLALWVGYRFHKLRKEKRTLERKAEGPRMRRQQHAENYERRIIGNEERSENRTTTARRSRHGEGSENEPLLNSDSSESSISYGSEGGNTTSPRAHEINLSDTSGAETGIV